MPPLAVVVLLGLAAYRATRIFTKDTISEVPRSHLYTWAWHDPGDGSDPEPRSSVRTYVYEFFTCKYCLGVWCALVFTWMWFGVPWSHWHAGRWLLFALGIAGVQAFLASHEGDA